MSKIFTMSAEGKSEYCCNVVKIGEIKPIDGSDFLGETMVNGQSVVVRKDQVHEGDVYFYAANECQLNERFLSVNNLFEIGSFELNANAEEVKELLVKSDSTKDKNERDKYRDEAKRKVGFFNKNGRVRMIRLRKVPSYGFLFSLDEMVKYCPKAKDVNLEEYINKDFDTVDGELFVKAYVPYVPERTHANGNKRMKRFQKRVDRFDRIIPGEFVLQYETQQLGKNIEKINPDDVLTISVKKHGKSGIFANVKVRVPIKLPFFQRAWNFLVDSTGIFKKWRVTDYIIDYSDVCSSRKVIRNQFINKDVEKQYDDSNIWKEYNELLKDKLDKGMTVYGEIIGYETNSKTMMQKEYDYGCEVGTNKFMPYRITTETEDGKKYEWDVSEVKEWTEQLIKKYPDIKERIDVIDILYQGTLRDLYPTLDVKHHWHNDVLLQMKADKEHFGMELNEPLCKAYKVPREGVVIRINGDPVAEAFKLKTDNFFLREKKEIDKGNIDAEMSETYTNEDVNNDK